MRFRATLAPRWPPAPLWAIATIAVWLGLLLVVRVFDAQSGRQTTVCAFKLLTGYPCPTCGGTRAVDAAARGHFSQAIYLNPLVCLVMIGLLGWLSVRLVLGRRVSMEMSPREKAAAWVIAIGSLAANWAYVLWRGL